MDRKSHLASIRQSRVDLDHHIVSHVSVDPVCQHMERIIILVPNVNIEYFRRSMSGKTTVATRGQTAM